MGGFLFGLGIAGAIMAVVTTLSMLGYKAFDEDILIAKIILVILIIAIISALIIGGLTLGVTGINM